MEPAFFSGKYLCHGSIFFIAIAICVIIIVQSKPMPEIRKQRNSGTLRIFASCKSYRKLTFIVGAGQHDHRKHIFSNDRDQEKLFSVHTQRCRKQRKSRCPNPENVPFNYAYEERRKLLFPRPQTRLLPLPSKQVESPLIPTMLQVCTLGEGEKVSPTGGDLRSGNIVLQILSSITGRRARATNGIETNGIGRKFAVSTVFAQTQWFQVDKKTDETEKETMQLPNEDHSLNNSILTRGIASIHLPSDEAVKEQNQCSFLPDRVPKENVAFLSDVRNKLFDKVHITKDQRFRNRAGADSDERIQIHPNKDNEWGQGPIMTRISRRLHQGTILSLLQRWSVIPPTNLCVRATPRGNVLGRLLLRAELGSDVQIEFDRVAFRNIRISGGGRVDINRMSLHVPSLLLHGIVGKFFAAQDISGSGKSQVRKNRFSSPFDFHAQNCTFTQEDLAESSCIRNGLQNLLRRILGNFGLNATSVHVHSVGILPSRKVSCTGTASTILGTTIPFEVRSGVEVSCRGHVLTFPGLEISLHEGLKVFVPVVPDITLDIGHNAKVDNICFDGRNRCVRISARVTVTPTNKTRLKYVQEKESFLAHFACDVGKWIIKIGKF